MKKSVKITLRKVVGLSFALFLLCNLIACVKENNLSTELIEEKTTSSGLTIPIEPSLTIVHWDLDSLYGINQAGFASVINKAKQHFATLPNDTIMIHIAAGSYTIGGNGGPGINFGSNLNVGEHGRLIFVGAGMNSTKLIFTEVAQDMLRGYNINRLEFRDMHMARDRYTVTQGTVVSVTAGSIVLDIHAGFPTPLSIYSSTSDQGRYLRRYTSSLIDPQVIQTNNDQVPWGWRAGAPIAPVSVAGGSGNLWRIYLANPNTVLNNYAVGELVGIKSKHEGNVYWFSRGNDLVFRNIKWTGSSRGLVRNGFSNVLIKGCRIERDAPIGGQVPCLSTPSGGPQMNQLDVVASSNMVIDSLYCDSPGDDCVAFFNVNGGKVINCTLRNSFARGIYLTQKAQDICVLNTTIPNSPIQLIGTPTPIVTTPLITFDLNEAYSAGIINTNCGVPY
ncbi:hypothetical protein [Pedobacter sp. MW01-1-1]|uniref:hypothetical protein n=1 Tax=Pedobacter sp. MW01-1-1 TaxID=3383027 RepID=UPI003FED5478